MYLRQLSGRGHRTHEPYEPYDSMLIALPLCQQEPLEWRAQKRRSIYRWGRALIGGKTNGRDSEVVSSSSELSRIMQNF